MKLNRKQLRKLIMEALAAGYTSEQQEILDDLNKEHPGKEFGISSTGMQNIKNQRNDMIPRARNEALSDWMKRYNDNRPPSARGKHKEIVKNGELWSVYSID